jgi:hypothetical protein
MDRYPTVNEAHQIEAVLIRPRMITNYQGTFGSFEVEEAASRLVDFFKQSNRWTSFHLEQLYDFYRSNQWNPNGMFFGLTGGPHVRCDGMYDHEEHPKEPMVINVHREFLVVTRTFINRCARNVHQTEPIS